MSDVVHAFMESKHWKRGAIFVVYDEWGGFFDHVRPPRVPDIRNSRDPAQDYGQMGIRIPAVAISPWVKRGHVAHSIYGFESILKMIEYRYGLKPLTRRDAYAQNIARSFDWKSKPRLALPGLPDPPTVAAHQCENQLPGLKTGPNAGPDTSSRPKEHDLVALLTSGYLDELGFKYRPASPESTYRQPKKVESRLKAGG
jgi:phospholipase C